MLLHKLKKYNVILASASPRRHELIKGLGIDFTYEKIQDDDESFDASMEVEIVPEYIAKKKSLGLGRNLVEKELLITADTMVLCDGEIMGKPLNREDAVLMLRKLSGNKHIVLTGVCLRTSDSCKTFTAKTDVWFKELSDEEINYYINNYAPYDKAGSYGAQEWIGYIAISKIEGSYFNVMGLPVHRLYTELGLFISE